MIHSALRQAIDRHVTPEELRDALERPIPSTERDEVVSLRRWFTTRYPSPEERLAYVRQVYARWQSAILRSDGA
jgi:hypothetical protein